jgi:hypothetical protein
MRYALRMDAAEARLLCLEGAARRELTYSAELLSGRRHCGRELAISKNYAGAARGWVVAAGYLEGKLHPLDELGCIRSNAPLLRET